MKTHYPVYANGFMAHVMKNARSGYGKTWFVVRLNPGLPATPVATKITRREALKMIGG